MTIYTQHRVRRNSFLEEYQAPLGSALGAIAEEQFVRNPLTSIFRSAELGVAETGGIARHYGDFSAPPESPVVDATAARERIKTEELDLTVPDDGIRQAALDILIERAQKERRRKDVLNRAPTGFVPGALKFLTSVAVSALDPINDASAFIPVVGPARYAAMVARAGGAVGRAGVRAGVGAVEGAVGAALIEPIVYAAAKHEQADYDLNDSLLNIALGTALGGGLHVGAGAIGDAYARGSDWRTARATERLPRVVEGFDRPTREAALRTGVAQAVSGRNIDVEPVVSYAARQGFEEPLRVPRQEFVSVDIPKLKPFEEHQARDFIAQLGVANRLTPNESGAVNSYASARTADDEAALWSQPDFISAMKSASEKIRLPQDIVVFRGSSAGERLSKRAKLFTPVTFSRSWAETMAEAKWSNPSIHEIVLREGTPVVPIFKGDGNELELLVPPGTSFIEKSAAVDEGYRLSSGDEALDVWRVVHSETATRRPENLRATAEASFAAENIRLYDGEAVRIADERIASAPADDKMPDLSLEEAMEDAIRVAANIGEPEIVTRELAPFDELAVTAEEYGRAVLAAATCQLRRGA